jgi:hypothetical protein
MIRAFRLLASLGFLLAFHVPAQAEERAAGDAPVLVELFTSQGCSSCPPADALLGELAQRPDVLALSFHVDYWNYIGWTDPFSSKEATERQRSYSRAFHRSMVYTPQVVVAGRLEMVGSDRSAVEAAIRQASGAATVAPRFLSDPGSGMRVAIPAGSPAKPATIWLAFIDSRHTTPVRRGENAGATLTNYNVVREWRRLGEWRGEAMEVPLGRLPEGRDGCAVIVQEEGNGPVLGAALMGSAPPG